MTEVYAVFQSSEIDYCKKKVLIGLYNCQTTAQAVQVAIIHSNEESFTPGYEITIETMKVE
jgi:hypothetical protein